MGVVWSFGFDQAGSAVEEKKLMKTMLMKKPTDYFMHRA